LSRDTPGFEVHAPDSAALTLATTGAARAAAHYSRLFGKAPARFATVLFDTEAQRLAHHDARYRERGLHVQRWRARTIDARKPIVAVPLEPLGIVARVDSTGALRVAGTIPGGPGATAGLRNGDMLTAWNGEPLVYASAPARARALARSLRVGDSVTLSVARAGTTLTVRLRAAELANQMRADMQRLTLGALESSPVSEGFVAHETVHQLVGHHYGTLPAWFNEGIASLVETPSELAAQQEALRRHRDALIPLAELFSSAHPVSGGEIVSEGATSSDGGMLVVRAESDPAAIRRAALFYPQSRAVLEFLLEREGSDAVRRMAEGLRAGKSTSALLAEMRSAPRDLSTFEREWTAWVRARLP
ncbi:MAG TPA: PDZ domain-containing protein, partial [Gemmatimonas sp.]|nr:PDZ domain-containing protein [Gemmatimonas sp.]